MTNVEAFTDAVRILVAVGLSLLALATIRSWFNTRGIARLWIAAGTTLLALVTVLGRVSEATEYRYPLIGDVSISAFMAIAFMLLLVRHSFVPLQLWTRIAAFAVVAGAATTGAVFLPYDPDATPTAAENTIVLAIVLVWSALVAEPIQRFWRAAKTRPAVQRARLRMLSAGYASIVVILLIAVAAGESAREHPSVALLIQVSTLPFVALLALALEPPPLLRRLWREREASRQHLTEDLLSFASDREEIAQRALDGAIRLVGGDGGCVWDAAHVPLARVAMSDEQVAMLQQIPEGNLPAIVPLRAREVAVVASVSGAHGRGRLVVRSGPFIALFGVDEAERLAEHAALTGVALDRVATTEEIRRVERARREFIGNAAHELRTPLTSILGFASLLADAPSLSPEEARRVADAINRQAQRMRALVNNLLGLTQIEQGRLTVHLEPIDLVEAVQSVVRLAPPPEGHTIEVDVLPGMHVEADRVHLDQILTNLVTNAYRYGGTNVRVSALQENGSIRIAVADDGEGVPSEVAARIFDPFVRGHAGGEGSGLGLAIVRGLSEAIGGSVDYDANGRGARFVLTLKAPSSSTS